MGFYFSATYPVADTPNGDSNTLSDGQASLGDCGIIILLLGQLRGGNILGNADIELGDGDIQSGSTESDQLGLNTTNLAKNQMCLGADTVDGNATGLQSTDEGEELVNLVAGTIKIVVVDVKLCGRISCTRGLEGNVDEGLAENFVEDRLAEVATVIEDLVDDILIIIVSILYRSLGSLETYPSVYLSLITGNKCGDMVLEDRGQGSLVIDV